MYMYIDSQKECETEWFPLIEQTVDLDCIPKMARHMVYIYLFSPSCLEKQFELYIYNISLFNIGEYTDC